MNIIVIVICSRCSCIITSLPKKVTISAGLYSMNNVMSSGDCGWLTVAGWIKDVVFHYAVADQATADVHRCSVRDEL